MQLGGQAYTSSLQCARHLLETEGLRGVTRGLGATMIREVPGNALFFRWARGQCCWECCCCPCCCRCPCRCS
jgi:hypothetical protein